MLARSALAASELLRTASGPGVAFLADKIATARFYAGQLLPQAAAQFPPSLPAPLYDIDLSKATFCELQVRPCGGPAQTVAPLPARDDRGFSRTGRGASGQQSTLAAGAYARRHGPCST
jgi:hypothetical protein